MRLEDLRPIGLFDGLTDEQLTELLEDGTEVAVRSGEELFHEGDHADDWWVLVDGAVDLLRHVGREDALVGRMEVPGVWSGGFRAWNENGVYLATGRGSRAGRMLRVPSDALRQRFNAWFPFGVHLVAGLYGTARSIESTVRQREALVTLGQLSAGLAHEINNPAAAAVRAVDALESTSQTLLSSLRRLAGEGIAAEQFAALDVLRRDLEGPAVLDPLDLADREEELGTWLEQRGVTSGWDIAPSLAAADADVAWCARVADLMGASLEPGLEWVASTVSMASLLAEIKDSTRRVSELVAAVRSYSQMDRGSRQTIDVTEGIESTLVMMRHRLRDGVTVVRDYADDVPRLEAFPGELNQVWTNLIDNAVDAMDGSGTLRVATRLDGDAVVVEVADTGAGMSPDVEARAFEAFYTTKDVGKGTGLGLDIARRIVVERHGGEIDIDSAPGRTVIRASLPVRHRGG